jgi:hypothetical protein
VDLIPEGDFKLLRLLGDDMIELVFPRNNINPNIQLRNDLTIRISQVRLGLIYFSRMKIHL